MPRSTKPRKLILSPTKIRSWAQCRLHYKFTYLDKLARFYYKPNPWDTVGASVHHALQVFHTMGGAKEMSTEQLVTTLGECWQTTGFNSVEEHDRMKSVSEAALIEYWQKQTSVSSYPILIEKQLRWTYDDYVLMGRLDRLDEYEDGTLEIIDYKTGRTNVQDTEVADSIAMLAYSVLVAKHYPGQPVKATLVALGDNSTATWQFSTQQMEVFEMETGEIARQINGADEYFPSFSERCTDCIYSRLCFKGGSVDWQAAKSQFDELYW